MGPKLSEVEFYDGSMSNRKMKFAAVLTWHVVKAEGRIIPNCAPLTYNQEHQVLCDVEQARCPHRPKASISGKSARLIQSRDQARIRKSLGTAESCLRYAASRNKKRATGPDPPYTVAEHCVCRAGSDTVVVFCYPALQSSSLKFSQSPDFTKSWH